MRHALQRIIGHDEHIRIWSVCGNKLEGQRQPFMYRNDTEIIQVLHASLIVWVIYTYSSNEGA